MDHPRCRDAKHCHPRGTQRLPHGVETQNFASLQIDTHGSSVQTQIDLSHYAAGVYFVKAVADGNVVAVRKMVKR